MLIAAAVCPHPPLLVPEATGAPGAGDAELERLRTACRQAVAALLATHPDLIVVAGGAERTAEYPPRAPGRLHDFGVPVTVAEADPGSPALPLSLTIGKWLLAGHEVPPAAWWGIAADATPAECLHLGEKLAALAPRVALLAMGDGPARRARAAPHAADPEADRYDDQVAGPWPPPTPVRSPPSIPGRTAGCSSPAGRPGRSWPARRATTPSTPSCATAALPSR